MIISSSTLDQTVRLRLAVGANLLNGRIAFFPRIDFSPQSQGWQIINGKYISNANLTVFAMGVGVKGGHYGLTGCIIRNLKIPKKLRQGVQN